MPGVGQRTATSTREEGVKNILLDGNLRGTCCVEWSKAECTATTAQAVNDHAELSWQHTLELQTVPCNNSKLHYQCVGDQV